MTSLTLTTQAESHAKANLNANFAVLSDSQAELVEHVREFSFDIEWVFARDGSLTALDGEIWQSGCSLPHRAAESILEKLDVAGAVACFLNPSHAGHVRVALDKLRPEQAIIAIIPRLRDLALMLHCEDFSADMKSHRLWFAAGSDWDATLANLFDENPGLSTPAQFIRTPDADAEPAENLIPAAQRIFSQANANRSAAVQAVRDFALVEPVKANRICVIAPSRFRLWNDIGHAMLSIFSKPNDFETVHFDPDDPACSSPLALLESAKTCGKIFTANTSRTDLPGLLPETVAWITWVTAARIPSAALAVDEDRLILSDPSMREIAVKSGWRDSQIQIGAWPATTLPSASKPSAALSIIADTFALETPADLIEYSSHGLLWETIRHELLHNPFVLDDPNIYLSNRLHRHGVGEENFPRQRFIDKLILPAYQQGLARTLINAKLPLRLLGQGWDALSEFKPHFAGSIRAREDFHRAIEQSSLLLHVWPGTAMHPIDAIDRPIVRRRDLKAESFLRDARSALAGKFSPAKSSTVLLSAKLL